MVAFYRTDTPVGAFEFDVPDDLVDQATAVSINVGGTTGLAATLVDDQIVGSWFGVPSLEPGAYPVLAVFTVGTTGQTGTVTRQVDTVVFEDPSDGWLTLDEARSMWAGVSSSIADGDLYRLLQVARQQVEAYAPTIDPITDPPESYRQGQFMQARNMWNASKIDPASGSLDMAGGTSFVVRPLDWTVKQILRPQTRPVVG